MQALHRLSMPTGPESVSNFATLECLSLLVASQVTVGIARRLLNWVHMCREWCGLRSILWCDALACLDLVGMCLYFQCQVRYLSIACLTC